MKAVISIFKQYFLSGIRDKISLFWSFLFPLIILSFISLIFGNMTGTGKIELKVSLINQDGQSQSGPMDFAGLIEQILTDQSEQEQSWITLTKTDSRKLDSEIEALKNKERNAVVLIPEGFSSQVYSKIYSKLFSFQQPNETQADPQIVIYKREFDQVSDIAVSILKGIINSVGENITIQAGLVEPENMAAIQNKYLEVEGESFHFASYLLPGILLMSIMTTGLFTVVDTLLTQRDKKILRRYFTAPVTTVKYFSGILLYVVLLSIIQVIIVTAFGYFFFDTRVNILSLPSLFYLGLSLAVLFSLGFLIASVVKNATSGMIMLNVILYPLMFLGGLYFPLEFLPRFLQIFVRINPVTYLINGLRDSLGLYPSFTAPALNVLVPLIWLAFSAAYSVKRFRWEAD
jgi:ABC-2 type transport system permease protein